MGLLPPKAGNFFPMKNASDVPIACVKWYDFSKWVLERVESFPKNQRFVLGNRVSNAALDVLDALSQAAYASGSVKAELLESAQLQILRIVFGGFRYGEKIGDRGICQAFARNYRRGAGSNL
jgi:hypothetical protein